MKLIDGKAISEKIKEEIKKEVEDLYNDGKRTPHLAAILVGEDPASKTYVASKEKACKKVGITSSIYKLKESTTEKELLETIEFLNNDEETDGFIVQLPLPKHIDEDHIINAIHPSKDVDGFHPENIGKMVIGQPTFLPATPHGIMKLFEHSDIDTSGKHCVVLGRSNIVGTPISILMSRKSNPGNATVTLCHSKTAELKNIVKQADIIIAAIGIPNFVTEDMVKPGATIIDVGIHRIDDETKKSGYHLTGDVDFDKVKNKCSAITPVPGGVGPMTIAMLLHNTLKAYKEFSVIDNSLSSL